MGFEEKYQKDKKYYDKKVLRPQKVKLYRVKHWIFDFGGVMIEGPKVVTKLINIINLDLGTSISREHPYIMKIRRRVSAGLLSGKEFLEKIFEKFYYSNQKKKSSAKTKNVDINHYLELWFNKYTELTQLTPEMEETVERLHKADYHVSLMSNTYDVHAKSNKLRGFYDIFDNVFLSNELRMRKPDIEKYKYVLKKLDSKPKECIFIDDKLMNLVPARKLGIIVIKFESFHKFQKYLNELGIEDIDEDIRQKIKQKYKIYKTSKKDFKKTKKKVKSLKKELKKLKKKKKKKKYKYRKIKKQLRFAEAQFKKKKYDYKRQKKIKKEVLEPKFRLEQENET